MTAADRTPWSVRMLRPLEWEPQEDGTNRLRDPSRHEWVRTQAWTRAMLEQLDKGRDGADAVAAALAHPDAPSELRAKRFLLSLEKVGYLRIDVAAPDSVGAWRVHSELGRGGVGIAFACDRDGETGVAKVPWDFLHPWERAVESIAHEADVLARVDHPGIVRRLDLIEQDGVPVLVRERVDGETLTQRYEGRPPGIEEASRLTREVASIMAHLHDRGLLVIDYKPSNLVLDDSGVLRLLDVGHCKPSGTARVGGTPGFMPPELERREPATLASDVWGLGRIYAFLRSGRLPALRSRTESVLDGVPADAVETVSRLCHESADARPQSIADALAILLA